MSAKDKKPAAIICHACGAEAFLVRRPRYDGFTRTGENLSCSACGHVYADEADVPFKRAEEIRVFSETDRAAPVQVFREDEKGRICRYCLNYIVNPFTQWCAVHKKEVQATDSCGRFERRPESATKPDEP
jgi:hypothetical protein